MNFDKNTIIGFSLLGILLFTYFYVNSKNQHEYELQKRHIADSVARISVAKPDSVLKKEIKGSSVTEGGKGVARVVEQVETLSVLENNLVRITFSNRGGVPVKVELKKVKSLGVEETKLVNVGDMALSYGMGLNDKRVESGDVFFEKGQVEQLDGGVQRVVFSLSDAKGEVISHEYVLMPNHYLFDLNIKRSKGGSFFSDNKAVFKWGSRLNKQESNLEYEKMQSQMTFFTQKKDFDYFNISSGVDEKIEDAVKWISVKQQFFNQTLIDRHGGIDKVSHQSQIEADTTKSFFAKSVTNFEVGIKNDEINLQFYFGPTDYETLKQYGIELERVMNIGQGFYAFVKYINKYLVMPIFNILKNNLTNYGIVILLLTIFLRVITAPLLYTSYTSSAKMKILKPELDELKKKMGDDQQGYAMKQMELFKSAGVNPLGGCIPALLQIPIFLSLYYFFNSCIDLRGQGFLWAKDLSSYDSVYTFGFNIMFYGNHISLFTILNVITSFLISYTSMQNTPDQGNPMLKYMPYIFPVILLGFFNSLPSALTWYYTVSNTITLILQFVIQKYIINHDKLIRQIDEKRKQPAKKSSWMMKVEQMQNAQKKLQEIKKQDKK